MNYINIKTIYICDFMYKIDTLFFCSSFLYLNILQGKRIIYH
jgi:hypothetical protein